jgi:hypothetical protein
VDGRWDVLWKASSSWWRTTTTTTPNSRSASWPWQTLGFLERPLEIAGANELKASFASRAWTGDLVTTIELQWK